MLDLPFRHEAIIARQHRHKREDGHLLLHRWLLVQRGFGLPHHRIKRVDGLHTAEGVNHNTPMTLELDWQAACHALWSSVARRGPKLPSLKGSAARLLTRSSMRIGVSTARRSARQRATPSSCGCRQRCELLANDKLADGGRPPPAFVERSRTHPLARVSDLDPPSQALMWPGQAQAGWHCNLAAQLSGAERKLLTKAQHGNTATSCTVPLSLTDAFALWKSCRAQMESVVYGRVYRETTTGIRKSSAQGHSGSVCCRRHCCQRLNLWPHTTYSLR